MLLYLEDFKAGFNWIRTFPQHAGKVLRERVIEVERWRGREGGRGRESATVALPELSPAPLSSGPPRKDVDLCIVPLAWCLKMADESSSRVQPSR